MRWLLSTDPSLIQLLLRWTLAIVIFPHGAQKALGWFGGNGFKGTMAYFNKSFPAPLGLLAIAAEFLGPIGLAIGLLTRVAAFGIACVMVVAVLTTHTQHGFFMNWYGNQKGEGFEFHLLALGIALALILGGAGALVGRRPAGALTSGRAHSPPRIRAVRSRKCARPVCPRRLRGSLDMTQSSSIGRSARCLDGWEKVTTVTTSGLMATMPGAAAVSQDLRQRVLGRIDDDEVLRLAQDLIRIPSFTTEETPCAEWLASYLGDQGLEVELQEIEPGRKQAIARLRGTGGGRSIMLNGHIDIDPLASGWTRDPFTPWIADGRPLRPRDLQHEGRGDREHHGHARAPPAGAPLRGDVVVACVAAELNGGIGTRHAIQHGAPHGHGRRLRAVRGLHDPHQAHGNHGHRDPHARARHRTSARRSRASTPSP